MIYKELDPFKSDDKFAKSGRAAEEQMAFYLKRFFSRDQDILVLNGVRLEAGGDAAQVDHLIIHSHGIALVESKSVHGKVQIKDDGQWIRWFNGNQSRGIASPITQARLQERFFRDVLARASKNAPLIASLPMDIFVAISDSGVILWPSSGHVASVCKADQVPDKIVERRDALVKASREQLLTAANREKIAAFLVAANKPLRPMPEAAIPDEPSAPQAPSVAEIADVASVNVAPTATHSCRHCGGLSLEIRFGHTYFFHCLSCEKNTPVKAVCSTCTEPAKLRKSKQEFFHRVHEMRQFDPVFRQPITRRVSAT